MQKEVDALVKRGKGQPYALRVQSVGKPLRAKMEAIREELIEVHSHADEITLHYPVRLYNMMLTLNGQLLSGDAAPTQSQLESLKELSGKVDGQLQKLRELENADVGAFNRLLKELDVPGVTVKGAKVVM